MGQKKVAPKSDFSGYATKNGIKCKDGRTIMRDAFAECDGITVPLVWQHLHNEPSNILGHAILENREDGVYTYGVFNDTPNGQNAKIAVEHGDIKALSIYANELVEKSKSVMHGVIREVSLVMAGANAGALIENVSIAHGDGTETDLDDEVIIFTGLALEHADTSPADDSKTTGNDETVQEVFDTLSEKQKTVVYALIAEVSSQSEDDMAQSEDDDPDNTIKHTTGDKNMKQNVFDKTDPETNLESLSHAQFDSIISTAKECGSFRTSFLAHAVDYGIENIDYLFPDAKTLTNSPDMIQRRMEWVTVFMNGTKHTPFSRIKSVHADITAEEARAKGYLKGGLKKDEVITLLKRITTPWTVYKKQKLDRDDIIDITDLDVVAWMKAEMRVMLDEELARACLISDGRGVEDDDKISETNIRPIYKDADLYAHKVRVDADVEADEIIDAIIRARKEYKGSGNPVLFTTADFVNDMLLLKDTLGRRIYGTLAELEAALRVSKIVEVEVMEGVTRQSTDTTPVTLNLLGILVNLNDYTIGADKGGGISMFDDFDIDYNQYKYLLETRCCGALTKPKSALVIEQVATAG
ncbi:TPA: phage major capsid protein [Candidatus Nomurabacteria bacterium]|nr:phage major capsid protein [Candidatus Nomurabacteria bacterium]